MPATPMATLVVVLTAAAAAAPPRADSLTLDYKFEEYVQAFGKKYGKDEFEQRRIIYQQRLRDVVAHNAAQGQHKYKKGINHLSDWTDAELDGILGWVPADRPVAHTPIAVSTAPQSSAVLPSAVDWRACTPWADSPLCPLAKRPASPVTTSVKNQGHCGSCWAFASTATLESHFSLATGRSEALAPQHLVSCAPNPNDCGGTGGCQGSTADVAYDWLSKNGGLASAYTYGYASGVNGTTGECDSQRATPLARVGGFAKPASNDYEALMRAVATAGPVAVNVYASTWNDYESGVFDGCNYSKSLPINVSARAGRTRPSVSPPYAPICRID